MTSKPIIFSTPMVQALNEGRKTMTRRIVKPQPGEYDGMWMWKKFAWGAVTDAQTPEAGAPYQVGMVLWVKETFQMGEWFQDHWEVAKTKSQYAQSITKLYKADAKDWGDLKWRPSIFMPRWASRINLEVTDVKCERVQEITEEDAKAEGFPCVGAKNIPGLPSIMDAVGFAFMWNVLNASRGYAWELNPFVWVVKFKKI